MGKRQEEKKLKRMLKNTADAFGLPEENVKAYFDKLVETGISTGYALLSTHFKAKYLPEVQENAVRYNHNTDQYESANIYDCFKDAKLEEIKKEKP